MILSALLALVRRALAPAHDDRSGGVDPQPTVRSAAATFAPTSFARARLLRQARAAGLFGACPPEDPPLRAG